MGFSQTMPKEDKELKEEKSQSSPEGSTGKTELGKKKSAKQEGPVKKQGQPSTEDSQEELEKLKERNEKLTEERDNYKEGLLKQKQKDRASSFSPSSPEDSNSSEGDSDEDEFDQDTRRIVRSELQKEKQQQREKNLGTAFRKFCHNHPEYLPENDEGDVRYNRLKERTSKMQLGESTDEILDSLEFVHQGITKPSSPTQPESDEEKVEDSGVGSVSGETEGEEEKPDALTKPLSKYEQEAAEHFPGGEKAYRKKLAEKESSK